MGGFEKVCISCHSNSHKEYRKNPTVLSKRAEDQKKWRQQNPERAKILDKANYERNKQKHKTTKKVYAVKWRNENPDKVKIQSKEWYLENKERTKNSGLRRKYGITLEDFNQQLAEQEYRCAICKTPTPTSLGWVVDHDHVSGNYRSILCSNCNSALGMAKDDATLLRKMAGYLDSFSSSTRKNDSDVSIDTASSFNARLTNATIES